MELLDKNTKYQKLDNVKWLLSILMVLYHVEYFGGGMHSTYLFFKNLGECVVPAFAIISGFLFWRNVNSFDKVKTKMVRRIRSLVIPYLLWNFTNVMLLHLYWAIYRGFSLSILDINLYTDIIFYKWTPQFWYVVMLMAWTVVSPLLYFIFKYRWPIIVLFIGELVYVVLIGKNIRVRDFTYILFSWGGIIGVFKPDLLDILIAIKGKIKLIVCIGCAVVYLGISLLWALVTIPLWIRVWLYMIEAVAFIVGGLQLPLLYIGKKTKFRYSFWVFAIHFWLDFYVVQYVAKVVKFALGYQMITFVLVTAVAILTGWLLDKICRPLFNLYNGGR